MPRYFDVGAFGVEVVEQLASVARAKRPRIQHEQQPVDGSHARPLRSFGLARARSTSAPSCCISSRRRRPAPIGQRVVAALRLLAVGRIFAAAAALFDQPAVLQPLDRFVQRPGAEADRAAGALLDVLLDRVAVPRPVGEGEQDVSDREGQRLSGGIRCVLRRITYR